MISAAELLDELATRGATVTLEGGNLRIHAPTGNITSELLKEISLKKPELLLLVRRLPPLRRRSDEVVPKLSFAQQRLWVLDQLEPGSTAYNMPFPMRVRGKLDIEALQRSVDALVGRHEALRTTFASESGKPVQVIRPEARVLVEVEGVDSEQALQERLKALYAEPFDLVRGPLLRVQVLRLSGREQLVLLMMHHIVSDGWSMGVLFRELTALYAGYRKAEEVHLPELPVQYADYAVWQQQWLQGEELARQAAYWRGQLTGAPPVLELPTDRPRPAVQSYRGDYLTHEISPQLTAGLKALVQREGATLFMGLLTAFYVLLARWTGQQDLVVGTPIAGRQHRETEGLIGFFVNMLALRADISGDPTVGDLLLRVKRVALDAYAHQELPFEKLVEVVNPTRDTARAPITQVTIGLHNQPLETLVLDGLEMLQQPRLVETAKFELSMQAVESMGTLRMSFQYNTDLFDKSTILRLAGCYERLLEGIVADPGCRISELPLLGAAEREELVVGWSGTRRDYPREAGIHELFEEQAARTPEAVAIEYGQLRLSYRELNERANRVARYLRRHGVGPEVMVGLCVERGLELVVGVLGIVKAGGAYVPLDPEYPAARLSFMLEDTATPVLLMQEKLRERLPAYGGRVIALDTQWEEIEQESADDLKVAAGGRDLAYVIYTSGSTGRPKGTCIEHRSVVRLVKNTNYIELGPEEVVMQFAPISFDASTLELWGALLNGAKLAVCPAGVLSLEELGRFIRDRGVSTLWLTAALFNQMVDLQLDSLRGVRQLLAGGEALSVAHVRRMLEVIGSGRLINGYGPTENTTFTCCYVMTADTRIENTVPIGRPIANTQVYVLDRHLQPVPVGVYGELYIGGDGVARGYLNRPELTAEKFVADPFDATGAGRLYRTGDLVRWLPDGNLEFVGRIDNQVKVRGFRIELGEIEAVLNQQPQVREAVVVVREDVPGDKRLVAYVVAEGGEVELIERLREQLRASLPDYMMPSAFVTLEGLPLTPNGKVDRKALPAPERMVSEAAYVSPRTPTEEILAGIWAEVLKVERVGVHENFFELGGHSLLATQVVSRVRQACGVELPLREVFAGPTVAYLSASIDALRAEPRSVNVVDELALLAGGGEANDREKIEL